ncbi:MAG: sodium-dependent transporter, partial [Chitinophagales bacterium]
ILIVCDVRALLLPGAARGLAFLLKPDFAKVGAAGALTALGLAFFKLSLGMGTMITFGSYQPDAANLPATAVRVVAADTAVSLLAGLAIFPAVFSFGFKPDAGPSLLFITIPAVFSAMPLGRVFMALFFLLTAIAATGAMISLFEVPVAFLVERLRWRRPLAAAGIAATLAALGAPATLSFSVLRPVRFFGKGFFDLYDFVSSNLLLPVGGILTALFVGWRWSFAEVRKEGSNGGRLRNGTLLWGFCLLVRYAAPLAILVVLLSGLGLFRTQE